MENTPGILLVDDEPALADGHAAQLSGQYDVRTAYDGETALEKLDDDIDVVFLDRRMPGMSGGEVLDSIRDRGDDCSIVMLTGVEPNADIVEMGFDEYLIKPIRDDKLQETVQQLLTKTSLEVDNDVLDALGDSKTRYCCHVLANNHCSAQELSDETGYSLPTVYRRLNALKQAGIIEGRETLDPDGDHYESFFTVVDEIQVTIGPEFEVDIDRVDFERTSEQPV